MHRDDLNMKKSHSDYEHISKTFNIEMKFYKKSYICINWLTDQPEFPKSLAELGEAKFANRNRR